MIHSNKALILSSVKSKKIISRLGDVIYKFGICIRSPLVVAVFWHFLSSEYLRVGRRRLSAPRVLVLTKSAGCDDLLNAFEDRPVFLKLDFIPRKLLVDLAQQYLPASLAEWNYADPQYSKSKRKYYFFIKKALSHYRKLFGLSGVIQFSVLYHREREFMKAARDLGLISIAMHKESLWSQGSARSWGQTYKMFGKYGGTHLLVYQKQAKKLFEEARLMAPDRILVTGCSRLDVSHLERVRRRLNAHQQKVVVVFMIAPQAGLPIVCVDDKKFIFKRFLPSPTNGVYVESWGELIDRFNYWLFKFIKQNPSVKFILKGKTGLGLPQIQEFGKLAQSVTQLKNVETYYEGVGHQLLSTATVVIGFNTTGLFEACAAGIPVVVPKFIEDPVLLDYVIGEDGAFSFANNESEMSRYVYDALEIGPCRNLGEHEQDMLTNSLGNGDGNAGARVYDVLRSLF